MCTGFCGLGPFLASVLYRHNVGLFYFWETVLFCPIRTTDICETFMLRECVVNTSNISQFFPETRVDRLYRVVLWMSLFCWAHTNQNYELSSDRIDTRPKIAFAHLGTTTQGSAHTRV